MHVVALVVTDGVALFELAAPLAVFGPPMLADVTPRYDLRVCSGPADRVDRFFRVAETDGYDSILSADTVVVPACHDQQFAPSPELPALIREAHDRGARVMSICTGAFVLGAAGLLDGRPATTHWAYCEELSRRHPAARVKPDVLYVDDGDVLTSAGKSAGMDLCLHVLRRDHGAASANAVARLLVTPPQRSGGQAQYARTPEPSPRSGSLAESLTWAVEHLDEGVGVVELARHAGTTARTLNRHFRSQLGTTPHQWLLAQRILRAREMLECTTESMELIASRCGFASGALLRKHIRAALGVTPSDYRQSFANRPPVTRD